MVCIDQTLLALQGAGIAAQRGYAAGKVSALTAPCATVSVERATVDELVLKVQIFCPAAMGGPRCEDLAATAAEALRQIYARCVVGSCGFHGKTGLYNVPITASFSHDARVFQSSGSIIPAVKINGHQVSNVRNVSVRFSNTPVMATDPDTGTIEMGTAKKRWRITVEDQLNGNYAPREDMIDGFAVEVRHTAQKQVFEGCCWDSIETKIDDVGIRRTRVAITCLDPTVE